MTHYRLLAVTSSFPFPSATGLFWSLKHVGGFVIICEKTQTFGFDLSSIFEFELV